MVANPYSNMTSINKYDARSSTNSYLKDRAKAKALGNGVTGIANTVIGGFTGNADLMKSGVSDTIGSVSSQPIDMSSANNIYGYQGMKPNDNTTNGLSPMVGGALQAGLMGGINKFFPSTMSNGGRIKLVGGGISYTEDLMPDWLNTNKPNERNRMYDYSTYGDINKMQPKFNYVNTSTNTIPTLQPRETTTADNMVGGKNTLDKGFNLKSIADLNPLSIGSKLQNAGMNEYGVITDDASYYTGAVLNPIGAFANWAGNGFASQSTLKTKMGNHIVDMTSENLNNETNTKNAQQMGLDYTRLNNYAAKGNREVNMGFADGGRIPLASNAQQITGPKHAQGGVDITPNVEAEGGEVMAQSPQSGDTQVFSDKNGYADVVKPLLKQKGLLEKELATTGIEMLKLRKAFTTSKDDLSRAGIGRNLEKIQNKVFTLKASITQIDQQVEQVFAQQQQGNGNQGVEGQQIQGMRDGGYIASRGLKIPPVGDTTSYTPDDNIVDYTDVKYPINIINPNTYSMNTLPMFNYNIGSNKTSTPFNLSTLVPTWANGYQDNTNNRSITQNAIDAININRYNLPQLKTQKTYPLTNVVSTKETTTKDKNKGKTKGKWNFDGVQDIVIPATEYTLQSQIASKMENTALPKSEQYKFNPLDTRFTPDAELNLIQRNVNNTTNQIRNNSSNPYYANAVRANIAMESNDKSAAAIDKANKLNLDIYAQNNNGFNSINQANVGIRNQDKQLAYNKAITDLERRSAIIGNTTNRAIEYFNNNRAYNLQKKNLELDALKYNDTIGSKYTEGMIHGRLTEIFQDMKGKNADINTSLTTDEKANARKQYKELGDAILSTKQSGLIHNKLIELGFTWNGKKYVD